MKRWYIQLLTPEEMAKITIDNILRPDMMAFVESLGNPDDYSCRVVSYDRSLSQLWIHLYNPNTNKTYEMIFRSVEYLDAPMIWRGATFHVASFEDSMHILQRVAASRNTTAEDLLFLGCLYYIGKLDAPIARILAWVVQMRELK